MILYANGDSFVAGVELGDDIISQHPGYLPYTASDEEKSKNAQWIAKTYKELHPLGIERKNKSKEILALEYERSFPNKIADLFGCPVINHAQGGSSFDRIARTTIIDLIELRKNFENVVAIIGTTCPSRSEVCSPFSSSELDPTGFPKTWEQISTTYKSAHQKGSLSNLIDYKVEFEKNYHQLVNAYKNIVLIKNLCKILGVKLFWVAGFVDIINQVQVEPIFKDSKDLKLLQEHANFEYSLDMAKIASRCPFDEVLCPSLHFSEKVHTVVADKFAGIINGYR